MWCDDYEWKSGKSSLLCWVPQGSVLGPILFLLHMADLLRLIDGMELHSHLHADDTQVYGSCAPDAAPALQQHISNCVVRTSEWMRTNCLQLNAAKTEQLWCAPHRQQAYLPNIVGSDTSHHITSHGEDGCRPQWLLYPRNKYLYTTLVLTSI